MNPRYIPNHDHYVASSRVHVNLFLLIVSVILALFVISETLLLDHVYYEMCILKAEYRALNKQLSYPGQQDR